MNAEGGQERVKGEGEPTFAPLALDEHGKPVVVCEMCGSRNLELDGWDIDKCRDCGHWRYRGEVKSA